MANEIKEKYGTPTALTITLASLATSTVGSGRQSTLVDNTTTKWRAVMISLKIKCGTTPTANTPIYIYGIRSNNDATQIADDSAGASDAALTVRNCVLLDTVTVPATAGHDMRKNVPFYDPGPEWGIAIVQSTGVNLDSTESNHEKSYYGINPEVQ